MKQDSGIIPINRQETSTVPFCLINYLADKVDLLTASEVYQNLPSCSTTDRTLQHRAASQPQDAAEASGAAASPAPPAPAAVPASDAQLYSCLPLLTAHTFDYQGCATAFLRAEHNLQTFTAIGLPLYETADH